VRDVLLRSHIQTLTVIERRSAFEQAGSFDPRLPVAQDYLHWILVVLCGFEVGYLPDPLGQYRWRAGSLMSSQRRLLEDSVRIYEILWKEQGLERTHGAEMLQLVQGQLYRTQRQLAYLERREYLATAARKRIRNLIRQWPFRLELYLDLAKTYIGPNDSQPQTNPF
jgi:hypothetical protein